MYIPYMNSLAAAIWPEVLHTDNNDIDDNANGITDANHNDDNATQLHKLCWLLAKSANQELYNTAKPLFLEMDASKVGAGLIKKCDGM